MGTIEVDYEIKDLANYLASSEATSYAGTRWDLILNQLVSNPTMSPDSLGTLIAQTYFDNTPNPRTIAVKDLSRIENIARDIYNFAHFLRNHINTSASLIMNLRNQTESFEPYSNLSEEYIDLYQFAELIRDNINDADLQNAASNLMSDITSSRVYYDYSGYYSAEGYSIWFPQDLTSYSNGYDKYAALDFAQATLGQEWKQFLEEILTH